MKPRLGKKAYQPPRLLVYGDLTEMTRGTMSGQPDNGHGGKPKT